MAQIIRAGWIRHLIVHKEEARAAKFLGDPVRPKFWNFSYEEIILSLKNSIIVLKVLIFLLEKLHNTVRQ